MPGFLLGLTMHRQIVYPGQVPLETDLLNTNRHTLIALGMLTQAMLGTGTYVDGLPCTPGTGLAVSVGLGSIYTLSAIDATAYSSLPTNAIQIAKQGILLAPVSLACPAPITTGQSINYLVEVQFQEIDGDAAVLPYYNSANPTIAWSGPGGSGNSSATTRKDICAVQVKAGVAAATGAQVTPTADAGWTGLWAVSVAAGATTISAGAITAITGAPFLATKLSMAAGINVANVFTQPQTIPAGTQAQHAINLGQLQSSYISYFMGQI